MLDPSIVIPFEYRFTNFLKSKRPSNLPFVVGGATQRNPENEIENLNSQDAVSILIKDDYIVGVICDGCSSTHPTLEETSTSSNEVGAKLLSYVCLQKVQEITQEGKIEDSQLFVNQLSEQILKAFESVVKILCGEDQNSQELFIFHFLMSTILGFIVNEEKYLIFYSGDGIIGINQVLSPLESQTGFYIADELLYRLCSRKYSNNSLENSQLKIFETGPTIDLQNIFLATDGFCDIIQNHSQMFIEFFKQPPTRTHAGFDFLIQDFRKQIAWNTALNTKLKDDATFLLLRRVIKC